MDGGLITNFSDAGAGCNRGKRAAAVSKRKSSHQEVSTATGPAAKTATAAASRRPHVVVISGGARNREERAIKLPAAAARGSARRQSPVRGVRSTGQCRSRAERRVTGCEQARCQSRGWAARALLGISGGSPPVLIRSGHFSPVLTPPTSPPRSSGQTAGAECQLENQPPRNGGATGQIVAAESRAGSLVPQADAPSRALLEEAVAGHHDPSAKLLPQSASTAALTGRTSPRAVDARASSHPVKQRSLGCPAGTPPRGVITGRHRPSWAA